MLDVQADLLSSLTTRTVVPLLPASVSVSPLIRDLNPVLDLDGAKLVMITQKIATVAKKSLRNRLGSMSPHHDVVLRALDTLLLRPDLQ